MKNAKLNARVTGVLFILGTAAGVVAAALFEPLAASENYLFSLGNHPVQGLWSALLTMFMGFACAGIGISLYPAIKPYGEGHALATTGFRIMEGTMHVVNAFLIVALLSLGQVFLVSGVSEEFFFRSAGAALKAVRAWSNNGSAVFPWCIGAFIYYGVFFKTKLVPRWLSLWGIGSLILFLISAFGVMFGALGFFSPVQQLLCLPIALQEMVLALWLIVKGYRQ